MLHKKSFRAIFKLPYNSHTAPYFRLMKSFKLKDIHNFQLAIFLYKTIFMYQNNNIYSLLETHSSLHSHRTRIRDLFRPPRYHLIISQRSFLYRAIMFWNNLPCDIRQSSSLGLFKIRLRSFLLSGY